MANFIVIGTDNRLSDLVDGIEKCLPPNPNVETHLSTGKIEKRDDGIIYTYFIDGDSRKNDQPASFSDLLLNQIAAFRLAYNERDLLHIFLLENPMSTEELQELNGWMQEIGQVFVNDRNIYIHRVCLDYELSIPNDVSSKIPIGVIKDYVESKNNFPLFQHSADILYLHNRDINGADIVSGKEDHNFMLPRMLADFMMLLSSTNNSYGVMNAINQSTERCASIGYAESMYFFSDVRKYYEHADKCSLYNHILTSDDEPHAIEDDSEAMDIIHYPLGLNERKGRLNKYEDIPYEQDVRLHTNSADYIIDCNLLKLKDLLRQKCQDDIEQKRQEIEEKIQQLGLSEDMEEQENKLRKELDGFINALPQFISRGDIFNHCGGIDDEDEKEDYLTQAGEQYLELVNYAKGNDFYDYVKEYDGNKPEPVVTAPIENNPGCLARILPWLKKPSNVEVVPPSLAEQPPLLDCVDEIRKQTEMKRKYKHFRGEINKIGDKLKEEKKICDDFKLSSHSHHFYHLIDLEKMKEYQKKKFEERLTQILGKWNNEKKEKRTLARLKELLQEDTINYTNALMYIDWDKPFPFVSDTSDVQLIEICKKLYAKSSPFVHYETISTTAQNNINIALYSDIPNIQDRLEDIKGEIEGGTGILSYHSTHIASKICFLQILPLDSEMLQNIYELRE